MSLRGRLDNLESGYLGDGGAQDAIVYYDCTLAPRDPEERDAFLETLRPEGAREVVFLALGDNGRDPDLTRRLEPGYWVEWKPGGTS